ncbi:MAG: hypothetical protein GQ564_09000 [Bacteroidales bacterium]|nr:hypothetical protein [Bacteroidales bacterium]
MKKITFLILILLQSSFLFSQNEYYESLFLVKYLKDNKMTINNFIEEQEKFWTDSLNKIEKYPISTEFLQLNESDKNQKKIELQNNKVKVDSIRNEITAQKRDALLKIIVKYFGECTENANSINMAFQANPFFANFTYSGSTKGFKYQATEKTLDFGSISSISSGISDLDVTAIADGLAQFMISRAKDEISVAFIQRFKNQLEKYPELQVLFPETSDLLINILAYEYTIVLPTLQKSFEEDLSNMFNNVENIFELPDYKKVLTDFPEVGLIIRSMYAIAKLEDGMHPADILDTLTKLEDWDNNNLSVELLNLKAVLDLGNLFSNSLRFDEEASTLLSRDNFTYFQTSDSMYKSKDNDTIILSRYHEPTWVTDQHFNLITQNEITFKIFLGLIYQNSKNKSIAFVINNETKNDTIKFYEQLGKHVEDSYFLRSQFYKFLQISYNIEEQLTRINKLNDTGKKPTNDDYYNYVNVSLDVVEYGSEVIKYFAKDNSEFKIINSNKYISLSRDINEFYKASYSKDYTPMVLYGTKVIEGIYELYAAGTIKKELESNPGKLKKFNELSVYDKSYQKKINKQSELPKAISTISQYGTFMAQIAQADSGAQVNDIIETFALPAGSSSLKKYQQNNWAINSYLGYSYKSDFSNDNIWKLYAPIGISYTPVSGGKYGSLSIFASLIDIGAIIDYRIHSDNDTIIAINGTDTTTTINKNVEYSNKIQLGNILSPGCYIVYGFGGNIPLALGVGAQYGPALTKINADRNVIKESKWMFNVSLTVDIPIINIHPGKRKRIK